MIPKFVVDHLIIYNFRLMKKKRYITNDWNTGFLGKYFCL